MNYEFNSHLLATEFDKTTPNGAVKSLELSWCAHHRRQRCGRS